jgi:pyrimidine operon attenuation protein / uracil phosphoribosyltransferase
VPPSPEKLKKAGFQETRTVLDEPGIARALRRMATELVERHAGTTGLVLVGIRTRGVVLAERLRDIIAEQEGVRLPLGILDITLYRDDVVYGLPDPEVQPTSLEIPLRDRHVVLVDDVLFTGRTIRAALDAIMDFDRPRSIELAVLVDRGNRELPIQADVVGVAVPTRKQEETIAVYLREQDQGREDVVLCTHVPG